MPLTPGLRIGAYEVLSLLGAGGMGEVYRARDTSLNRDVALKVLPDLFANDPDRLGRFKREAQVLAALNHPNIGSIYGLEPSAGPSVLVLELVEGPTLADRIARGALPLEEAASIAQQIAEALEAAHEHGIVHRDLKPSNIKVRADGTVKVLDFGLAKALDAVASPPDASLSPTLTSPAETRLGVIMGTATYMSPEQARGLPVDKRADVWAFGCVLYEMLTGRRAFAGEDVSVTLARVIEREPDWNALARAAPASMARLVRRCLQKNPRDRLRDIGDARLELREALATLGQGTAEPAASPARHHPPMTLVVAVVAALAAGAAGTFWLTRDWRRDSGSPGAASVLQPLSTEINLSADAPLALDSEAADVGYDSTLLDISPDGRTIVYVGLSAGTSQLFVRQFDSFEVRALDGTQGAIHPFFSPDGRSVGFLTNDKVKAYSLATGSTTTICDARVAVVATWTGDQVFFASDEGRRLSRVSIRGGTPVIAAQARDGYRYGRVTPDGRHVLVTFKREGISSDFAQILLVNLETHEAKSLTADGYDARLTTNGYLVFGRSGSAFAARFDAERAQLDGEPVPIASGVRMHALYPHLQLAVSGAGVLAYVPGGDVGIAEVAWVSRHGDVEFLGVEPRVYGMFDLSDDGRRVAIHVADNRDYVLIHDIERNVARRLPTAEAAGWPKWSPAGDALAFTSFAAGQPYRVMIQQIDSDRPPVTVVESEARLTPTTWGRDGRLTFYEFPSNRIGFVTRAGEAAWSAPQYFSFSGSTHDISQDGRWIAYADAGDASGGGISVRPLTSGERVRRISDAGTEPRWCRGCNEVIFRRGNQWFGAPVSLQPDFEWKPPRPILRTEFNDSPGPSWALSADGQRILVLKRKEELPRTRVRVIHGWLAGAPRPH
ncbi:MAG TPA: protein kinase [Vicinamibacterales bacterium]|nr:protein kinase [Vicinamibacterales bacterium]